MADFSFTEDCEGRVSYTALILNNVPADQWLWNFGDGDSSIEKTPAHLFAVNNSYNSSLIAGFFFRVRLRCCCKKYPDR